MCDVMISRFLDFSDFLIFSDGIGGLFEAVERVLGGVGGGRSLERGAVNQTLIYPGLSTANPGLKGHQSY